MHYSILYQKVLPPWTIESQDIDASTEQEVRQLFRRLHPYNEYAEEYIIKINKHSTTEDLPMLTFKSFLVEAESESSMILNYEGPPLILSPTMFKRIFNIPDKEALHMITMNSLLNKLPNILGKAKQISTFTYLARGSNFFALGPDEERRPDAFIHVKGRVAGMFNSDVFSSILKKGSRAIELNDDTIEDVEFEHQDTMHEFADDLRELVKKIMGGDYPFDKSQMDGRQKQQLIKQYIDGLEKLISSRKYSEAVSSFMVNMTEVDESDYNEITMDKVKLIAIYLKSSDKDDVEQLKKMYRVPVYTNANERTIKNVLDNLPR